MERECCGSTTEVGHTAIEASDPTVTGYHRSETLAREIVGTDSWVEPTLRPSPLPPSNRLASMQRCPQPGGLPFGRLATPFEKPAQVSADLLGTIHDTESVETTKQEIVEV